MILRLSVVTAAQPARVVELRADPGRTAADLLDVLGLAGRRVDVAGEPLDPAGRVGTPPLLDGAVLMVDAPPRARLPAAPPLGLAVVGGPDSGRVTPLGRGRYVVGRSPDADVRIADHGVSRRHAEVVVDREGIRVHDLDVTNGSQIGRRPADGERLRVGEQWRLGHSTLEVVALRRRGPRRAAVGDGTLSVSPRPVVSSPERPVTLTYPRRPSAPRRRRLPWVVLVAPLPFAVLLAMFFGPRMLLFGLLSPVMMIGSVLGDRSSSRGEHRDEVASWRDETARTTARLEAALARERTARLATAPDPATVLAAARGEGHRLWERRAGGTSHLHVRVGLGEVPSTVDVVDGTEGVGTGRLHPPLEHAPVVLDLATCPVVGVVGPAADGVARSVIGQLLVLHSPHELGLTLVADDGAWCAPFAQVPHVRARVEHPASARVAGPADAEPLLAALARQVAAARADPVTRTEPWRGPAHVLVVDRPARLRGNAHLREVLAGGGAGIVVLLVADDAAELPHETRTLVTTDEDGTTGRLSGDAVPTTAPWLLDAVDARWADRVGRALIPLRDATPAPGRADLPASCRLLDVLDLDPDDPAGVRDRWDRAVPGTLAAPVGVGSDGLATLDLRTDGPHALLAGTTGSGKSELLQTWVTSLALHHSPERVSFVLVDYKGGAAFAACAALPHTVGVLTDLEPHHALRALASLDAELVRREHLLAAVGAADVDAYGAAAGVAPLPRLVLVIDEFRMLAEQQPDVLARLIRIAAVGRSLGVHLVLATQRPGGIVSADVRANVNLRLSLRVRDRTDSDDVLGCADAATIPEDLPGRLLVGRGSGAPEPVQTARVGGRAEGEGGEPLLVRSVGEAWPVVHRVESDGPTDLARLVETIGRAARSAGLAMPHRPWRPSLPEVVTTADLARATGEGGQDGTVAPFALRDVPEEQRQDALGWSPASGHWMVVGAPGSGRTTALRSVVTAAGALAGSGPVHVQVVGDGSAGLTRLAALPHVGSVVDAGDRPVLRRFLARLRADVEDRRRLLRERGVADLAAWPDGVPGRPPWLLLAVDGWARLTSRAHPMDLEDVGDAVESLVRDGGAVGLRLVVTGGRELLGGRIASQVTRRLVLHLPDRGDAALAGVPKGVLPEVPVPGRAVVLPGGHAVQVALPDPCVRASGSYGDHNRGRSGGPWVVTALPSRVAAELVGPGGGVVLGVGGPDGGVLTWVPARDGRRLLVTGGGGSGRTTAARRCASALAAAGHPTVLVAAAISPDPAVVSLGHDDHARLLTLRREHGDLAVVVDDADRVDGEEMDAVLREVVRRVDRDHGAVVITCPPSAAGALRGLVPEVARGRCGVLLQPTTRSDGDPLGVRVPPLDRLPGRGYLVVRGSATELQVATRSPDPARGGGSRAMHLVDGRS